MSIVRIVKTLFVVLLMSLPVTAIHSARVSAHVGSPQAVATFNSLGLYWSPPSASGSTKAAVKFRESGTTTWLEGFPLWYSAIDDEYRGSLVHLKAGTTYEINLKLENISEEATFTATTWSENFPIANTIYLPENSDETLTITQSGTANGYILYTFAPGSSATIDVLNLERNNIVIDASYIIIRGLTLRGAQRDAIHIYPTNSHDIVIEDNDISGWSNIKYPLTGFGEDSEAAIRADTSPNLERVIIQRNTMHHPRSDTNSWGEARADVTPTGSGYHPVGPQAVYLFQSGGNHVIRYNTIYSDTDHRFNDCIGGGANNSPQGFPNKDSDIYGNNISHCWDNGIEVEGGNQNVRVWGNYIDETYRSIANRDTQIGPLYVWRNVTNISRKYPESSHTWTQDPRGSIGKTGGENLTEQAVFYFHNTSLQPVIPGEIVTGGVAYGIDGEMQNTTTRNNIFHTHCVTSSCNAIKLDGSATTNDFNYDLYNKAVTIPGAEANGILGIPIYSNSLELLNSTGIFTLASNSPGYDDGIIIPNFNSHLIIGAGPDVGAHEAGLVPMQFGVDANRSGDPYTISSASNNNPGNNYTDNYTNNSETYSNGVGAAADPAPLFTTSYPSSYPKTTNTVNNTAKTFTIKLQIVDADGNPLSGVKVSINSYSGVTDENGYVYFEGISIGKYKVIIEYNNNRQEEEIEVKSPNTQINGYTITFKDQKESNNTTSIYLICSIAGIIVLLICILIIFTRSRRRSVEDNNKV